MRRHRMVVGLLLAILLASCAGSQSSNRYWGGQAPRQPAALPALPHPAVIPAGAGAQGGPGWLAAQLAAANTPDAERPLVLAALYASGFSVDGGTAASGTTMGVAYQPWEADVLGDLEASHVRFPLDDVGMTIARAIPGVDSAAVESILLQTVRNQVHQPINNTAQFWSQLIVDLGAAAPEPFDLMTADPAAVSLDGVQIHLLVRSAASVMAAWAKSHGATAAPVADAGHGTAPFGFLQAIDASAASPECTMSEGTLSAQDIYAYGGQGAWNKFTDWLDSKGFGAAGSYNKFLSGAGIMLAYLKLLITFAELKMKVRMDSSPLVRTIDPTPGDLRRVTAHAYYDTGNEQILNCIRWMLIEAGLDLNVPQHGDLTTGAVYFKLVKGGGKGGIVEFKLQPAQTSLTVLTDEKGEATSDIEGQGRKPALPANAKPVNREAQLELVAKAKGGSAREDAKDILGSALVLATDPTAILTVPADILYRTRIFAPTLFTVPVIDHAADYKVDYTLPNGLRLTGTKCGGPAGEWNLDVTGDIGPVSFTGLLDVNLLWPEPSVPPKGDVTAITHPNFNNLPKSIGSGTSTWAGSAHMDKETLVVSLKLHSTTVAGATDGRAWGDTDIHGFATVNIPTTMGSFCDENGQPSQS